MINRAVPVKQVFICGDETIGKYLYNVFLAMKQLYRATLAGFGENNGSYLCKISQINYLHIAN